MNRDLMDLERIRRNWERSTDAARDPSTNRLADVQPPADPYAIGKELVERLRLDARTEFPKHEEMLRPFLERVETLFSRMSKAAAEGSATDPTEARTAFMAALRDLEELCEVFAGLPQ